MAELKCGVPAASRLQKWSQFGWSTQVSRHVDDLRPLAPGQKHHRHGHIAPVFMIPFGVSVRVRSPGCRGVWREACAHQMQHFGRRRCSPALSSNAELQRCVGGSPISSLCPSSCAEPDIPRNLLSVSPHPNAGMFTQMPSSKEHSSRVGSMSMLSLSRDGMLFL